VVWWVAERGKVSCGNRGRSAASGPATVVREITMQSDPVYWIHIGLPKTASTTIQHFLTSHRDALLQRGVLYPRGIARGARDAQLHRALGAAVEPESVPWLAGMLQRFAGTDIVASLLEEVDRTKPETVILSSEALAFMRRPNLLRHALRGCEVHILVYLRRQDNFLASFYNQLIKTRLYAATFEEFLRQNAADAIDLGQYQITLAMCQYDRLLELWAGAFGPENIVAGVYEDYDLPGGILRDMAAKMEIDIAGLRLRDADTNPALQPSMLSLKRRVNQLLSSEEERVTCELLFASNFDGATGTKAAHEQIAAEIRRRQTILSRYQEGNARVAEKFFNCRPLLFNAPNGHDSPLPDFGDKDWQDGQHGLAAQMIARLISEVSRFKKDRIGSLPDSAS
jgi:hypothetical protein